MAKRPKSRKTPLLIWVVVVGFVLCGIGGGLTIWITSQIDARANTLGTSIDAARRAGIATTLDDLKVDAPSDDDARPTLDQAFLSWSKLSKKDRDSVFGVARAFLSNRSESRFRSQFTHLEQVAAPVIAQMETASRYSSCSIPKPEVWSDKADVWDCMREGVRLIYCRAISDAEAGRQDAAISGIQEAARLTRLVGTGRTYSATVRQCASEIETQRALNRVFLLLPDRGRANALLAAVEREFGPLPAARQALQTELALVFHSLDDAHDNSLQKMPGGDVLSDVGKSGIAQIWTRYFKQMPSDPEAQDQAERVLIAMDAEGKKTDFYGAYVRGYKSMMPLLREALARRRLAEYAIGSLAGHPNSGLIDPFSDRPLLVKGNIVYSVGPDLHDDGGQPRRYSTNPNEHYDLVFWLSPQRPPSPLKVTPSMK